MKESELIQAILDGETVDFEPKTRNQAYLKACCEKCGCEGLPTPVTVNGALLYQLAEKMAEGGGGDVTIKKLTVTENGTYRETGKAYSPVVVNVPMPTGEIEITSNGTVDVSDYASAEVNVPNPSTGSLSITDNGTYDVTEKASAVVNVPKGIPVEISTAAGMAAVLISANVGKAYKFTGTTDATYTSGDIYVVEVAE